MRVGTQTPPPVPRGYSGIVEVFGDIRQWIRPDGTISPSWEQVALAAVRLPAPLRLSWLDVEGRPQHVEHVRCHHLLIGQVERVFSDLHSSGNWHLLKDYGGCYNFRRTRRGRKLSTHAWGIAFDVNPTDDPQGDEEIDQPGEVIAAFERYGFFWGGRWTGRTRDAQHFQYALDY